eukprot:CAMPEP_0178399210 /NCGR_PEP_ID=MMETSP0689_2-20121128/15165_1 /TAXON_ID=160604 /ORGANISM="Amphidinium massartii, Strain CS-259" /LENGTH=780 /DNA_ID=CAMNT_0020019985 /DNA_START=90 /DNA_END=2432 /DNA_ORIENTATION=-
MADEAQLMRDCAPLYISVALESFSTFIMGLVFLYLLLLITNKGRLQKPGLAFRKFMVAEVTGFFRDLAEATGKWKDMPNLPLQDRFATCRKMNQAICSFQLILAALTISRWLHIGNVNGFRYLGYAVTCPPMQAELIMLIAPIVPFYKFTVVFTYCITTVMELSAWAGSLTEGDLFANMDEAFETGDGSVLVPQKKFFAILPGVCILSFLMFFQIPYLQLLFCCKKDKLQEHGCPPGYLKLLLICQVTWVAFPAWWLLGFEGLAIIHDTKMNAVGFAALNVLSKATFSVHMIGISGKYRKMLKAKERAERAEKPFAREETTGSNESQSDVQHQAQGAGAAESWFVRILRPYDAKLAVPEKWNKIETDFKAYLMGCGVTPTIYDEMTFEDRQAYHARYTEMCEGHFHDDSLNGTLSSSDEVAHVEEDRKVTRRPDNDNSGASFALTSPVHSSEPKVRSVLKILDEANNRYESSNASNDFLHSPRSNGAKASPARMVSVSFETGPQTLPETVAAADNSEAAMEHEALKQKYESLQQQLQDLAALMQQELTSPRLERETLVDSNKPRGPLKSVVCCAAGLPLPLKPKARSRGGPAAEKQKHEEPPTPLLKVEDLMLGQLVTTAHGLQGRVCQKTPSGAKLITSTGAVQHVDVKDVTVLLVTMMRTSGLASNVDPSMLRCKCEIVGKPSSKVLCQPGKVMQDASWNYEGKLLGYASGDSLQVDIVTEADPATKSQGRFLGSAVLPATSFRAGTFEGEVQLLSKDGQSAGSSVMLLVMALQASQQ